jgi:ubiquinone/menaquinone biosynthesis C-methylase UbiE
MNHDSEAVHAHVLSLLDVSSASAVLDVGCGRGEHLQMLSRRVSEDSRLVGIDSSEKAIESAREATAGDPRYSFLIHDLAEGIPFEDAAFDRIISVNVLEAIPDRYDLLSEVHRVLTPSGRVVFSHFDWDSQLYDGVDKALVRRVVHAFADWKQKWMADADGWMGRRLWRTFQRTGRFNGSVDAYVHMNTRFEPGQYGWERTQDFGSMVKRGMITAEDYDRFVRSLEELAQRNEYFYAITMFSYVGEKSTGPYFGPSDRAGLDSPLP